MTSPDDMQTDVAGWTVSIWLEERRGEERRDKQLIPALSQISLHVDISRRVMLVVNC